MATSGPLTATFDPARAAVALEVDGSQWGTDPGDITHITITRQVAGTPDVPVRGVDNLAVIGGAFVGSDIEAPLHETVTYQLVGVSTEPAGNLTYSVTISTTGTECGLWLKVAGRPDLTHLAILRHVGDVESATQGGVYDVIGGHGVAVAAASGSDADRVQVTIGSRDDQATAAIRAVLEHRIVLLQSCEHRPLDAGWYFVSSVRRSLRAQTVHVPGRDFELTLTRAGVPAGAGQGVLGWDYQTIASDYPDYQSLIDSFEDFWALLRGPGAA